MSAVISGTPDQKPLPVMYAEWLATTIDAEGVSLPSAFLLDGEGALSMYALAVPIPQAYRLMLAEWESKKAREIIFAFDRFTKPGQGTTLGDLMAGFHLLPRNPRPFIIEYQHAPRIVKPIAWDNGYWNAALRRELLGHVRELVGGASS